jgi:hypothetical protein
MSFNIHADFYKSRLELQGGFVHGSLAIVQRFRSWTAVCLQAYLRQAEAGFAKKKCGE